MTDVVGMSVVDRTVVEGSRTQRCGRDVSGGQDRGGRVENSKMWWGCQWWTGPWWKGRELKDVVRI